MDFWANIEHILCYKKEVNQDMKDQLKIIADHLRLIEYEMDELSQITIKQKNCLNRPVTKIRIMKKEENNKK